ncbi:MAG TPA: HAMP domain-containing sensor histidine kinase [Actinomycetota bacterium]|nr:HAMP domain-containing sensor histidine kinase [Actinomycetota bacterium]
MTLRRRILLGCTVIAVVLLAADIVLAVTVRTVLLDGVDNQLTESARRITRLSGFRALAGQPVEAVPIGPRQRTVVVAPDEPPPEVLTDLFIAVLDDGGNQVFPFNSVLGAPTSQMPEIQPAQVAARVSDSGGDPEPFTVQAADGSQAWRMVAASGPGPDIVVVGMSLQQMSETLSRVIGVAGVVTAAILTILAAVAVWMIRLGVRPMTEMAGTAEAIAAGDLDRRVEVSGSGTEAARLGASLNTMLERIGEAFAARRKSEERLRRFVADASHELRTPLTSILGYAELWRSGALNDPEDQAEAMRRLDEEARRMGVLVDDLLLLAHLDEGRPLEKATVDLHRIVTDAAADFRAVAPDRPVTVEAGPALVEGDESRLRQVVANLLTNARVHTPAGTPVHVALSASDGTVRLEVADEGPGIDPAERPRLFERFYRADPARSRSSGGAGLGLAIVAAIVEAHGGRVSAEERSGGGACFAVELPASPQLT